MTIKCILQRRGQIIHCYPPHKFQPVDRLELKLYLCLEYTDSDNSTKQVVFDTQAFNNSTNFSGRFNTWNDYLTEISGHLEEYEASVACPNYMKQDNDRFVMSPFGSQYVRPVLRYPDVHEGLEFQVSGNDLHLHPASGIHSNDMYYWIDLSQQILAVNGFLTRCDFNNSDIHNPYLISSEGASLLRGTEDQTFQFTLLDFHEMLPEGYPEYYNIDPDISETPSIDVSSLDPDTSKAICLFGRLYFPDNEKIVHDRENEKIFLNLSPYELGNLILTFEHAIWGYYRNSLRIDSNPDKAVLKRLCQNSVNQCFLLDFGRPDVYATFVKEYYKLTETERVMPAGASGLMRNVQTGRIKNYYLEHVYDDATVVSIAEDNIDALVENSGGNHMTRIALRDTPFWFPEKRDPEKQHLEIMEIFSPLEG